MNKNEDYKELSNNLTDEVVDLRLKNEKLNLANKELTEQLRIGGVVSSLTAKDKLYLNTLLVNKLLEKDTDGSYKAVNDIEIMDRVNDLMEKVNNS